MSEKIEDQGYYESAPKLEDRPSLYSATIRRPEYSDWNPETREYKWSDEQLIELVTYWQGEYDGEDYYSPRALKEMKEFITSVLFELRSRQMISNALKDEIDAIEIGEAA